MKKINLLLFLAFFAGVLQSFAIDWSGWLSDGAGGGKYSDKYKISVPAGMGYDNIQHPGFATADGIYITFPSADYTNNITIGGEEASYDVQGAGIILHLSNFTAQETEIVANDKTFYVYYADGTTGGGDTPTPPTPTTGIDWSKISWVQNSNDKFKVGADASLGEQMPNEVVNVQQPSFATKNGIYMTFPGNVLSCTLLGGIQGGGIVIYIDQFTAQETKVTVTYEDGSRTFTIYYADGTTGGGGDEPEPTSRPQWKGTVETEDHSLRINYVITFNENGTLTFDMQATTEKSLAQSNIYNITSGEVDLGAFSFDSDNKATLITSTTAPFTENNALGLKFRIVENGSSEPIVMPFSYTVGADNTHCGECFQVTF